MAELTTKRAFDAAVNRATDAAASYYDTDVQVMTDGEYDALIDDITSAVDQHPDWDPKGLLTEVSAGTSGGGSITHPVPMLSLGKVKELSDVRDFVRRVATPVIVEPKLDGLAVRAEYEAGELVLVATRGDGLAGEDVTNQAVAIRGLPARLKKSLTLEVRGEVFMTDADFLSASANRVAAGKPAFANPRNATAGSLRNTDSTYETPMSFAAYDASGPDVNDDSYVRRMRAVSGAGIGTAVALVNGTQGLSTEPDSTVSDIEHIHELRPDLGFPIDGAVVKVDSIRARDELGAAARTPRWAAAYKYPADTATSILRDIEVTVGRTGRLGLRGVIDPVNVAGTVITYATVHNIPWIAESGILINGYVTVYRAGDVIPRITAPAAMKQPKGAHPWVAPTHCPQCGHELDTTSALYRCVTAECSTVGTIQYAVSRDCLDIEGIGLEVTEALVDAGLVSDIADLYSLTAGQLADVRLGETPSGKPRLVGGTIAAKIITEIDKSRTQPFNRVVTALGIRTTGRTICRRLAAHFKSMQALQAASIEQLMEVEGIATEKAEAIHQGIAGLRGVISRLAAAGVTMRDAHQGPGQEAELPLSGLKVVVSGSVPGLTRTEAQEWVERLGGTSSSSVSASTDLLVAGPGAGSKADKAAALGIRVMEAEDFARLTQRSTA